MIVAFSRIIIFALSIWLPCGLCLNFGVGNNLLTCRATLKRERRFGPGVPRKKTVLRCLVMSENGQAGSEEPRCAFQIQNLTRHHVKLTGGNCKIDQVKYSGVDLQCSVKNVGRKTATQPSEASTLKFGALRKKYIVYFINSTQRIRNPILRMKRIHVFDSRRGTKKKKRDSAFLLCSKLYGLIGRERRRLHLRSRRKEFGEIIVRKKRHTLANFSSSSAFPSYFPHIARTLLVTPPLTRAVRTLTEVSDLCPRSVVVNRSTIFLTPTIIVTQQAGSPVATSRLVVVTYFTSTQGLRNTSVTRTSHLRSLPTLALNASRSSGILAHLNQSAQNLTHFHNAPLVSPVVHASRDHAPVVMLVCATVAQLLTTTQKEKPTMSTTRGEVDTKNAKLYIGLIASGGVVLSVIICGALFLLVRRYRRVQALRRKAKQISYFNKFDCSGRLG